MARELSTIATDAKVERCLVASEVMLLPDATSDILESFLDLVPLTYTLHGFIALISIPGLSRESYINIQLQCHRP